MLTTTRRTGPVPYSKVCDTFRPRVGQSATTRTDLGRKRFIHFFVPRAIRNRLVREHLLEGMPRGVVNAFGHLGLGQFATADVARSDVANLGPVFLPPAVNSDASAV